MHINAANGLTCYKIPSYNPHKHELEITMIFSFSDAKFWALKIPCNLIWMLFKWQCREAKRF